MDKVFSNLISYIVEFYVNDMIIKAITGKEHQSHLEMFFLESVDNNIRLNAEKCFFNVKGSKLFGFMLRHKGIEVNINKSEAFLTMRSLCNLKEVQHLNGKLATLSKFLPRLMEKAKPFLRLLKGIMKFHYNENY